MRLRCSFDVVGAVAVIAVMAAVLFVPASALGSASIVVTNTHDSGPGSFREAILDANASGPGSTIVFNIPETDPGFNAAGGWFRIAPLTQLPELTADGTTIDGGTQTTFTGDTNPAGPEIFLDGRAAVLAESPDPPRSLWIESSSTVEGLTVSGFAGDEIYISGANGAIVRGDYVGTDPTGMSVIAPPIDLRTFENEGVQIVDGATNTTIGGTSAADRNVISGNTGAGVYLSSPDNGVVIEGNYIGTNATGTAALANGRGIAAGPDGSWQNEPGPTNVTIGGTALGAGNLISGNGLGSQMNGSLGIGLGGVSRFTIQGNLIGTDATGSHAIPNDSDGVQIFDDVADTVIGGTSAAARNVISGNTEAGIHVFGTMPGGSGILGNYIGTDVTGAQPLGNGFAGIVVDGARGIPIGGVAAGAGNVIAFNHGDGVTVYSGTGNAISRNSIFSNGGLGIDLGGDGVTLNDPGDTDAGPNNLQNFPVLTSALVSPGGLVVRGTIDTPSPQTVVLEFFANSVPVPGGDPSGYGEGAVFLGTAAPAPDGSFTAVLPSVAPGTLISATATDAAGNTSEFAQDSAAKPLLPTSKDQCKNGGWQSFGVFKNQGDCVSFVATGGKNLPG
jgi:hypothetical protein